MYIVDFDICVIVYYLIYLQLSYDKFCVYMCMCETFVVALIVDVAMCFVCI